MVVNSKYIIFSLIGLIVLSLMITFFNLSQSKLAVNNQGTIKLFSALRHAEATLEKNVLRTRTFIDPDYKAISEVQQNLMAFCAELLKAQENHLEIQKNVKKYCDYLKQKNLLVEEFKQQDLQIKTAINYLHEFSTKKVPNKKIFGKSRELLMGATIVRSALMYKAVPTREAKSELKSVINQAKELQQISSASIQQLIQHAEIILKNIDLLDATVNEIVHLEAENELAELINAYILEFRTAETKAEFYRKLSLATSILLLIFIVIGVFRLTSLAHRLYKAKETLEFRVNERTSELKKSREIILAQQQTLITSAKLSALGEMAGGVAHEINTPLAIISLKTEQIEVNITQGNISLEDLLDSLQVIKKTTMRIANIIKGLKFIARDTNGIPFSEYHITKIVDETLGFCVERFMNRGVNIEFKNKNDFQDTTIFCRPVEISQVLLNLLNNACDAVSELPEKWIELSMTQTNEFVEIHIVDSGNGIPLDVQEKMMQPFFTTKPVGKGTGLGLSISRGIIESHHGNIFLDNQSKNTKFTVRLLRSNFNQVQKEAS